MTPRPAVFLDRDGTLIEERHYPVRAADIVPVPGAGAALARLAQAGYLRVVLTNQSAVARAMITEEELGELHEDMLRKLAREGGGIDALYYCPHHPEGRAAGYAFACACRKPERGLLDLAVAEHDIDLARSAFIGDSARDLFAAAGPAGPRILVANAPPPDAAACADHVAPSFPAAVNWLLERASR
ncbi:MAG TPA: HAD-IIIA family hydrolase [Planctomycetota bacterium]|nr:HAD-IIIA family hydrolase [Planctomycetota bacterium]